MSILKCPIFDRDYQYSDCFTTPDIVEEYRLFESILIKLSNRITAWMVLGIVMDDLTKLGNEAPLIVLNIIDHKSFWTGQG